MKFEFQILSIFTSFKHVETFHARGGDTPLSARALSRDMQEEEALASPKPVDVRMESQMQSHAWAMGGANVVGT